MGFNSGFKELIPVAWQIKNRIKHLLELVQRLIYSAGALI